MLSEKKIELSKRLKLGVGRAYNTPQIMKLASFGFLILAIILTGNALRIYSHRPEAPSGEGQVLGATDSSPKQEDITFVEYQVKKGDTLFSIAVANNIQWTTLATLNNLEAPFNLKLNQKIKIPKNTQQ